MKFCKDCKFYSNDDNLCHSPKNEYVNMVNGEKVHLTIYTQRHDLQHEPQCDKEGKWFEPRAVDPGEGWRLLNNEEKSHLQKGDEVLLGNTWLNYEPHINGLLPLSTFRRRIEPQIEKCPEGHEATCNQVCNGFFVACNNPRFGMSWTTTIYDTRQEAIAAWNAVMRAYHAAQALKSP